MFRLTNALAASAILTLAFCATVYAESGPIETLKDLRATANAAAQQAGDLKNFDANSMISRTSQASELTAIKEQVNRMGRQAAQLESEYGSLPNWEQHAIDEVMPMIRDAANNTEQAIRYCRNRGIGFWTTQNRTYADHIAADTATIAGTLGHFLNLNQIRHEESRLTAELGEQH